MGEQEEKSNKGNASFGISEGPCDNCGEEDMLLEYKPAKTEKENIKICEPCFRGMFICANQMGVFG